MKAFFSFQCWLVSSRSLDYRPPMIFLNLIEPMFLNLRSHILLLDCKGVLVPLRQRGTFLTLALYAPDLWGCRPRGTILWSTLCCFTSQQPHSQSPIQSPEWSKVRDLISYNWWTCNDTIGILNFIHKWIHLWASQAGNKVSHPVSGPLPLLSWPPLHLYYKEMSQFKIEQWSYNSTVKNKTDSSHSS